MTQGSTRPYNWIGLGLSLAFSSKLPHCGTESHSHSSETGKAEFPNVTPKHLSRETQREAAEFGLLPSHAQDQPHRCSHTIPPKSAAGAGSPL